jgi:hypothetical protein
VVRVVEAWAAPQRAAPRSPPGATGSPGAFKWKPGAEALGMIYAGARATWLMRVEGLDKVPEGLTVVRVVAIVVVCHVF